MPKVLLPLAFGHSAVQKRKQNWVVVGRGCKEQTLKLGEELEPAQVHHLPVSHTGQTAWTLQRPPPAPQLFPQCPVCPFSGVDARHEIETLKFVECFARCGVVTETTCFLTR